MDWKEIKLNAKNGCKGNYLGFFLFTFVCGLIMSIVGTILTSVGVSFMIEKLIAGLDPEGGGVVNSSATISIVICISLLILMYIIMCATNVASYSNAIDMYYGYRCDVGRLFRYLAHPFSCMGIMWGLFWRSLIPIYSIVCWVRFPIVLCCKGEDPYMSAHRCWKETSSICKGHTFNLFLFQLSLIGWSLLCMTIIGMIWAVPRMYTCIAGYWDSLYNKG